MPRIRDGAVISVRLGAAEMRRLDFLVSRLRQQIPGQKIGLASAIRYSITMMAERLGLPAAQEQINEQEQTTRPA